MIRKLPHRAELHTLFAGPRRLWLFILGVALACAAVWAVDIERFGRVGYDRHVLTWWELAGAFYLAEVFVVHLQFRKQAHTLSLTEIGLVLGLFLASPAHLLVGQTIGATVALAVNRRQRPIKLAFNMAELPLCTGVGLFVFRTLAASGDSRPHLWLLAIAAAAVAHTTGVGLVSAIIGVAEGRLHAPQLSTTLAISLVGAVSTGCLGLSAVELIEREPSAALLLVVPLVACVVAFRAYMQQREQREHVEFLYESMRATQGAPEFGLAVGQLLVAARRLLRAEYAEILLASPAGGEGPIRSVSGPSGELLMHPEESFWPDDARAFAQAGLVGQSTLLTRRRNRHPLDAFVVSRGLEDAVIGPLRGENGPFGLLIVGNRTGDVSTFDEGDAELFETFSGHASVLLENGRLEHSLAQVTELKEQLKEQAYHDPLTGLANRAKFVEAVEAKLAETGEADLAVLFLDLDRFKVVNDTWGHGAGDELLVQVADRLAETVRGADIAARLGGDEFAVLLHGADEDAAVNAAHRLTLSLGGTYTLSAGEVTTHASIGVAVAGPNAREADLLVRNADIAMYSAKRSDNRRYALYEPSLHDRVARQRQLALHLERAVERDEIIVHFQPIVSLADGRTRGFEALARWQHPERGLLPAAAFLATAEEYGLIVEIGSEVIRQTLVAAQSWPREVGIWLNLAPAELANDRLVEDLAFSLTRAGVESDRLTVEITESSVIQDEPGALRAMRRLRDLGVHLSIDDFGTGYSSLSRLTEFPIESLKIPKTFVDKLVGDDPDDTFVHAILRLADSLGLTTVGEGIEHPAQVARLRELGCALGQGYLFSRPVAADGVARLLAEETRGAKVVRLRHSA